MKNINTFEPTKIKGNKYLRDHELLSRIRAALVIGLIGMLLSKYMANHGFGSRSSCFVSSGFSNVVDFIPFSDFHIDAITHNIKKYIGMLTRQ